MYKSWNLCTSLPKIESVPSEKRMCHVRHTILVLQSGTSNFFALTMCKSMGRRLNFTSPQKRDSQQPKLANFQVHVWCWCRRNGCWSPLPLVRPPPCPCSRSTRHWIGSSVGERSHLLPLTSWPHGLATSLSSRPNHH
jgi:hypothetical protein